MRRRFILFILIIQAILFAAHGFLYATWMAFHAPLGPLGVAGLQAVVGTLSVSFVAATLLAFRTTSFWSKLFYKLAAVWLGALNYLFIAAGLCWVVYLGSWAFGFDISQAGLVASLYGLAGLTSVFGLINARFVRVRRVKVKLENLPPAWRGRTAALISDLHLGHVNGRGFLRRLIARLERLRPDVVFIAGDHYDGVRVSAENLAAEWRRCSPALGVYFITGNHEEFTDPTKYLEALRKAGVRVLNNERARVDGLDVVGVCYGDLVRPGRLRAVLQGAGVDPGRACLLLAHAPRGLKIAEEAGVSLQLSGHTHAGQIFPFTWIIHRVFREYTYGLHQFGRLKVYTSSGCGTWGPPLRVGTRPEIALIEFE